MFRINGLNTIDLAPGKKGFKSKNTAAGVPGTEVTEAYMNDVQEELCTLVEAIEAVDAAKRDQVLTSIQHLIQRSSPNYATAAGSANVITLTLAPAPKTQASLTGAPIRFKVALTNTGAATLNVNGLGAKNLSRQDGAALSAGDLFGGSIVDAVYDGTVYRILSLVDSDIAAAASIPSRMQVFFASGTFTVPAGVTAVDVEAIGAGGGSAATGTGVGGSLVGNAAGGGGGGGYSRKKVTGLTPGSTVPVTVGTGGATTSNPSGVGATGGTSSFGAHCSATGGVGAPGGNLTSAPGGAGGVGSGGDINIPGSSGGFSGPNTSTVSQSDAQRIIWRGGQAPGGYSLVDFSQSGLAGLGFGTGAAGGTGGNGAFGGNAANGIVIVRW